MDRPYPDASSGRRIHGDNGTAEDHRRLIESLYASFSRWELPELFQVLDEKIFWQFQGDQETEDEFWS